MGNKKLWLVIVLLFVSGTLFGQVICEYMANFTEQQFIDWALGTAPSALLENFGGEGIRVEKLPNTVIQRIDYALNDYSLEVGDVFSVFFAHNYMLHIVLLRITDVRNTRWQFYAWNTRKLNR